MNKRDLTLSGTISFLLRARVLALLVSAAGLQGCATQLVAVGDWGRKPDLHLDAESLSDVRVAVTCHRFNPRSKTVQIRNYRLCGTLEQQLSTLGADVVATDDEPHFTLQFVELGGTDEGVSAVSYIASALTGWLIPFISSSTSRSEFRILDRRGIQIDTAPMTITEVKAFGWGALAGLRGKSLAEQQSIISRKFFALAKNRVVSHARSTKWAQP